MNKYILPFFLFLFALIPLNPVLAKNLTWSEVVDLAQKNSPKLLAIKEELKATKANYRQTLATYYPTLSATADLSRLGGEADDYTSSSYGLSLGLPIFSGFSRWNQQQAAKYLIIAKEMDFALASAELRLTLRQAFLKTLFLQQGIILDKKILERFTRNTRFLKLRYKGGVEANWVYSQALADEKDAKFQLGNNQRSLNNAKAELLSAIGLQAFQFSNVSNNILISKNLPTLPELLKALNGSHPLLLSLKASLAASKSQIAIARARHYPTISSSANYQRSSIGQFPNQNSWSVGGSLTIPLYRGGATISEVNEAKADYASLRWQFSQQKLNLESALISSFNDYQSARQKIPVAQSNLKAALERVKTVDSQYAVGIRPYLDWEQAQSLLTSVQRDELNTRYQVRLSLAQLNFALGKGLER